MTGTFEPPTPSEPSTVPDPVVKAKLEEEKKKAAERIQKAGGKPPEAAPAPEPAWSVERLRKEGMGIKWKDDKGRERIYAGKGKQSKAVKDFLAGKPGDVKVVGLTPDGQELPPAPTMGVDGLPAPGTEEYKVRMDFATEGASTLMDFLSDHYRTNHNNPMTREQKNVGVFMCKWCIFKYADYIQNQPEAMAATFIVGNHMQHTTYISTKTNEPTDHDTWYLEQGLKPPPFRPILHGLRKPPARLQDMNDFIPEEDKDGPV